MNACGCITRPPLGGGKCACGAITRVTKQQLMAYDFYGTGVMEHLRWCDKCCAAICPNAKEQG